MTVTLGSGEWAFEVEESWAKIPDGIVLGDCAAVGVDSKGNVFLLQRLGIKGDKVNTQIAVPAYVKDIAKVQIYCAWAEVVLGETTFDQVFGTN